MTQFTQLFPNVKPAIAMVHLDALPGAPLFNAERGVAGVLENARKDLRALNAAGFDAVMFGNENDRPYELQVDPASLAATAWVIGALKDEIVTPFGVNLLWDPIATMALAAATGAHFAREILTGVYASDMGVWAPDAGKAIRYRDRLGRRDLAVLFNINGEFAHPLDARPIAERARSVAMSSLPDAVLVSGGITGEAAEMSALEAVKTALPSVPVLANTGVKHETVGDVFAIADGCVVGSSLKVAGDTWNAVDPDRAADFMDKVRQARGG